MRQTLNTAPPRACRPTRSGPVLRRKNQRNNNLGGSFLYDTKEAHETSLFIGDPGAAHRHDIACCARDRAPLADFARIQVYRTRDQQISQRWSSAGMRCDRWGPGAINKKPVRAGPTATSHQFLNQRTTIAARDGACHVPAGCAARIAARRTTVARTSKSRLPNRSRYTKPTGGAAPHLSRSPRLVRRRTLQALREGLGGSGRAA